MENYSEDETEIANLLLSAGVDSGDIAEVMDHIANIKNPQPQFEELVATEDNLKIKMMEERDWRKKAALAAMIISKGLE